jgi:hypothetical protein
MKLTARVYVTPRSEEAKVTLLSEGRLHVEKATAITASLTERMPPSHTNSISIANIQMLNAMRRTRDEKLNRRQVDFLYQLTQSAHNAHHPSLRPNSSHQHKPPIFLEKLQAYYEQEAKVFVRPSEE